jgi:hypothetical protein
MVQFFKPGLQDMIGHKVDLVFCNKDEALKWESRSFYDVGMTEDLKEGVTSFKERRAANFKGR